MKKIEKILVPVDFSPNSTVLLDTAVMFADKFKADVHAIFVVQTIQDYSGFYVPHIPINKLEEDMVRAAEGKMDNFIAEYPGAAAITQKKVFAGEVAEEIVEYAKREAADLIIMGTHGYKGLEKILFGSVAEKVVKMAGCPVLTINPYK